MGHRPPRHAGTTLAISRLSCDELFLRADADDIVLCARDAPTRPYGSPYVSRNHECMPSVSAILRTC